MKNISDELTLLINKHKIDVLSLSEAWLYAAIEDINVAIDGYQLCLYDRQAMNKKGAGLLLYVNDYFKVDASKYASLDQSTPNLKIQIAISRLNHKSTKIS